MNRVSSFRWFWLLLLLAALSVLWPRSGDAKSLWHLRAFGVWVEPDLDFQVPNEDGNDILARSNGGLGLGVSVEYQFSERLGVELGLLRAYPEIVLDYHLSEIDVSFSVADDLAMTPLTLGLDIHLLPENRLDLYLAPFVAHVRTGDLEFSIDETFQIDGQPVRFRDTSRVEIADKTGYGATLGLDVPFSSRPWAFAASLRYLALELEATDEEGDSIRPDFDSWILTAGLRYSF